MNIKQRVPIIKSKPKNMKEWICNIRGIKGDIESFFSPTKEHFENPFNLVNMNEAVKKYHELILNSGRIYFYADV